MRWAFPLLLFVAAAGCAPEIGDSCETSVDCSVNGDRICDIAQPGGYCTVVGCETDTCPDEAVCVEFRSEPERLASAWCMAGCEEDGDCRDGYLCTLAADIEDSDGNVIAMVLDDNDNARFCAVAP